MAFAAFLTDVCAFLLALWALDWVRRRIFRYRGVFESQGIPVAKPFPWRLDK